MCLSVRPTAIGTRKCLQKQQGGKWGLKTGMPVWHGHFSVSAALPTTGSAVSDKYKHHLLHSGPGIPVPETAHWLAAGEFPSLAPDAKDTLSVWDTEMGAMVSERLFVARPRSNTSHLSGNIYKAITPSPFIQQPFNWQHDRHLPGKHWHTNMLEHCTKPKTSWQGNLQSNV